MKEAQGGLSTRVGRIRAVLSDVDGVLTDGAVWVGPDGELAKRFSVRDGMGFERLRQAGLVVGLVTKESSPIVTQRADKLGLDVVMQGVQDKRAYLEALCRERDWAPSQVAYIGDDLNDLEVIQWLKSEGLTAAPADAMPAVREHVHLESRCPGGHGAFREFAEWILARRNEQ